MRWRNIHAPVEDSTVDVQLVDNRLTNWAANRLVYRNNFKIKNVGILEFMLCRSIRRFQIAYAMCNEKRRFLISLCPIMQYKPYIICPYHACRLPLAHPWQCSWNVRVHAVGPRGWLSSRCELAACFTYFLSLSLLPAVLPLQLLSLHSCSVKQREKMRDEDAGIARPYCGDHHEDRTAPDLGLPWSCTTQSRQGLDYGLEDVPMVQIGSEAHSSGYRGHFPRG
jgi:hypothetical protein